MSRERGRSPPGSSTEIRVGGGPGDLVTTETAQTQRAQKFGPPARHHPPANPAQNEALLSTQTSELTTIRVLFILWKVKKRELWVMRGRCRIIASTLVCLVCDKAQTCFLFKTVQMLITMHVALLTFYFKTLIYVEIDVCVVPNWSYVMICDRKFNLKTTCVESNICD